MKPRVVVPPVLEFDDETLFILARGCYRQEEANEYIRLQYPNWVWANRITKIKGVRGDAQAAGSYSLDLCVGGFNYHSCSPDERGSTLTPDRVTGGVATIPEVKEPKKAPYPQGTRRLSGRDGAMWLPPPAMVANQKKGQRITRGGVK